MDYLQISTKFNEGKISTLTLFDRLFHEQLTNKMIVNLGASLDDSRFFCEPIFALDYNYCIRI